MTARTVCCKECRQLITYVIGELATEVCATCSTIPGWFNDPQLRQSLYHDPVCCPNCGSTSLDERIIADVFPYGAEPEQVQLVARVPLLECKCGLEFTDVRAEELRDEAVRHHLESK